MGFLDKMADAVIKIKKDKEEVDGLLEGLKDTFKKTDIVQTVDRFKKKGLDGTITSWISYDENKPITKNQIKDIFTKGEIKSLSKKSGFSEDEVPERLSEILPDLIDSFGFRNKDGHAVIKAGADPLFQHCEDDAPIRTNQDGADPFSG